MITSTNTRKNGNTIYLRIPPHLVEYLQLEDGIEMEVQDDEGKHGKFISVWRKDQKEE